MSKKLSLTNLEIVNEKHTEFLAVFSIFRQKTSNLYLCWIMFLHLATIFSFSQVMLGEVIIQVISFNLWHLFGVFHYSCFIVVGEDFNNYVLVFIVRVTSSSVGIDDTYIFIKYTL